MNYDPASARAKPTFLFKDDKTYNMIFDTSTNYSVYLNCCLIVQIVSNYIKYKITDKTVKNKYLNFTYHISRITTSIITSEVFYQKKHLESLNVNEINKKSIEKAIVILDDLVKLYQKNNPNENIINIAKSKKYKELMLRERLPI